MPVVPNITRGLVTLVSISVLLFAFGCSGNPSGGDATGVARLLVWSVTRGTSGTARAA